MTSSEETATGLTASPTYLKPIKTKLRLKRQNIRQCRLCMRVVPRADTHDTMTPGSDLCQRILDAVLVEIFPYDKVTSVCSNCVMIVDIINDFRTSCEKADMLHGTKLMMMHPGSWLSEENKQSLGSCHRLIKRNRTEMDSLFRCSGVNDEQMQVAEPPPNFERVDLADACQPVDSRKEVIRSEPNKENAPKISEQDTPVEEARRMAAKKEAKTYMCEICGKLMQKMYMEEHTNMHTGLKPYKCTEENCSKSFGSTVLMSMHVSNVHRKGRRFKCDTCHKSIKGLAFYNQHLQTHQAVNPLKVPCKVCGNKFYKRYIRDHMFIHTGETPYRCEFCGRKFAARNNLAVHRRKQHSDQLASRAQE